MLCILNCDFIICHFVSWVGYDASVWL